MNMAHTLGFARLGYAYSLHCSSFLGLPLRKKAGPEFQLKIAVLGYNTYSLHCSTDFAHNVETRGLSMLFLWEPQRIVGVRPGLSTEKKA
ncbi:hypothetical protein AK812_SmicGene11533 [Symbiodinium microadriaticum]|uniref:Uncharacterized protein n=1 Tax=Symbiodinium microadriaticum TaxID=2951 RepID=A0A1Q9ECY3_SYMMI|nr:hypothetical protein AK812_SmicGene11533 [Symbiodinium microadriaticum]